MTNQKTLAQIRADAEREAKITFRTGYTCPDVALTEVAETIARQAFDACAKVVMDEAEKLAALLDKYNDPIGCDADEYCYSDANELVCFFCLSTKALARWTAFKKGNEL